MRAMKTRLMALAAMLLLAAAMAAAADTPPPLKIYKQELKNGLKVVMAPDSSRPVINLQIWYQVGSKDEKPGRTGFAHLFEHIMFRGSKNVGPEEHMRFIREAGGTVNAYTGFDRTVYWETFPSNYLERVLWLEADRMESLAITEGNFTKEREVVKEERRLRVENPPYGELLGKVLSEVYNSLYKHEVVGSMDDLNKAHITDVQDFFNAYYVPNNATLVIVGDFEPKQALALAEKHLGRLPRSKNPVPRAVFDEPPQPKLKELETQINNAPLPAVVSAYHLPPMGHPDSYALEIASAILSAGQSSRLYRKLVYEEQSALQAAGEALLLEGPSLFFAFGVVNQGKNVKDVSSSLQAAIEQMRADPVTGEELAKAKNQIIARFILGRQSMQSKADALGQMASLRKNADLYNTELANYQKVTAADVQRVCRQYLVPENETRMFVTAKGGGR